MLIKPIFGLNGRMVMNNIFVSIAGAVLSLSLSAAASAQYPLPHSVHFAPASTSISGTGTGAIGATVCLVTWTGLTGPDVSGVEGAGHTGHADYVDTIISNYGAPGCDNYTTYARLYANGTVTNVQVYSAAHSAVICAGSGPYEGAAILTGNNPVTATVSPILIGDPCGELRGVFVTDEATLEN